MPLLDDGSVQRSGNDLVTGIYFASPDDGDPPTGIAFANATTAITFWGSINESGAA